MAKEICPKCLKRGTVAEICAHDLEEHTPIKHNVDWFLEHVNYMPWDRTVKVDLLILMGVPRSKAEKCII